MDPGTSRQSYSWGHKRRISGIKISDEDLIEWVTAWHLTLKNKLAPIGREVPLSRPQAIGNKLMSPN